MGFSTSRSKKKQFREPKFFKYKWGAFFSYNNKIFVFVVVVVIFFVVMVNLNAFGVDSVFQDFA